MHAGDDPPLILARDGAIARITLNRPGRGNALSAELVEALLSTMAEIFADERVHTLVLSGTGRNFCTGFDLGGIEEQSDGDLLHRFVRIETALAMLWEAPIRTLAVAAGRCWGAGADLFAACETRFAMPSASFRFPGARFGIVLGTRRLAERVGTERARHWQATGSEIAAEEALAAGLATELLSGSIEDRVAALAPPSVPYRTLKALNEASRSGNADRDLAALVRSAAMPGLRERILAYSGQRKGRGDERD